MMRWSRVFRSLKVLAPVICAVGFQAVGWAADHGVSGNTASEQQGLPPAAPILFKIPIPGTDGALPVTNSMVLTWVVALVLVAAVRIGMKVVREVPEGAQNFWEWLVEGLYDFLGGIIGPDLVRKTFWFFASLFIFVVATNWFGLLPGVGSVGWGHSGEHGFHVSEPLLRGANADFNMTFAMALVFFFLWTVWALQANGPVGFLKHLFGAKGGLGGFMGLVLIVVFFAVGLLEVVSILFRPVSLSFRLFGNVFAGENMLESMTHLGGATWGWLTALPFYFMELLVGLVQALVFMLLTAVFTLLICSHDEEHAEDGSHH